MTIKSPHGNGIPTNMGLDHVGLIVPNVQEAANFLIDVFDAHIDWEVKRDPRPTFGERGWADIFDVHPDAYMPHVMMLKCGEHPLTQYVELFEWVSPDQYVPPKGWHKFSDQGNSYISFTVGDMDRVIDHIKNNVLSRWPGTRLIQDPPMDFPLRGEVCTSTFLVSPWGMWIEISCWSESKKKGIVIAAQREEETNPLIGAPIGDLPTPSFLIDLDIVDYNCTLMRQRFSEKKIDWRIPSKAHKCPDFAKYMMKRGAKGVVLLTLDEAEKFADHSIDDIYLANILGTPNDLERLSLLAKRVKRLRVAADNAEYIQDLSSAVRRWEITSPIEVLVELNINHNRCGTTIDNAALLARLVYDIQKENGSLVFAGITGYEGHTPILSPTDKTRETGISHSILKNAKEKIEAQGILVPVVSGGGSCNYMDCLATEILTEIQAGGGALGDLLYYHKANLKDHGHKMGAMVLTQIVSIPEDRSRAVGDAGFKSIGWHPFAGLAEARNRPDIRTSGLSAEHIRFDSPTGEPLDLMRGQKILLTPAYVDAMGFLHGQIYAIRGGTVEYIWPTVASRI
jgi:3-hydroxy-D-aspartate aldolase